MAKYTGVQRKKDVEELVGQEVEGFKFESGTILTYNVSTYDKLLGKKAKVERIHPDYAYAEVRFEDNHQQWYPIEGIREQVKMNNRSEDELYGDIYSLLKKI